MRIRIALFLLLFISALYISAQDFNIKNISIEDGLLTNEIHDIHQDELGNMWFATGLGVIKYDGYNFKNYSSKNGLTNNIVFKLKEFNNTLWINTYLGGLCYFKNDSIIPYEYNAILLKNIGTSYILDFTVREDGLWFSLSFSGGIYHISNKGNLTIIDNHSEVTAFVRNFKNSSLTGFFDRTYYSESIKFHRIDSLSLVSFPKNESSNFTRFISSSNIYSYRTFLFKINDGVIHSKIQLPYDIISHFKDNDDNIWIGTLLNGVLFFKNGELQSTYIQSLSGISISDILQDRQGNIWFSSIENGLFLLKNLNSTKYLKSEKISNIECIDDVIFCGTQKGNLYKIYNNNISLLFQKKGGPLKDILVVDENNIIANSWRINFQNGKLEQQEFLKRGEIYLKHKNLLVSAFYGIQIYEDEKLLFDSRLLKAPFKEKVKKLLSGNNDTILVLANSGLYYYNNKKIKKVNLDSEINVIEITDIMYFNNSLLIATSNNGVYITNQNKISQHLSLENGLKSDNCVSLAEKTENSFCVGSNKGIDIVTINNNNYTVRNLNHNNILSSNDVNIVKVNEDKIIIGTDKGLEIINDIHSTYIFNPLIIQSVEINNKNDSIDNLTLDFNQNNIKITFVSPHYSNEISYRYRLKGADNSWSITKQNFVRYNRLSVGSYIFQVQVFINDQFGDIAEVDFAIRPHFTSTWWFIALVILIIIWVIYLVFMDMKLKEKYKREAIQSTQIALRSQMNPHFLFNALNSIQNYILRNEKELSVRYLKRFSDLIRKVLHNSKHDYISLKDDLDALEDYIFLEKIRFKGQFNYKIVIDNEIDVNNLHIPPLLLQPIIENSIWHGLIHKDSDDGLILITFKLINNEIICTIDDNGVGRKIAKDLQKGKKYKSVGISITRDRLKVININSKLNYNLIIEDKDSNKKETGTRVILSFPNYL